tara:strand:- start:240 stop:482 length:243 start_codon:yes stop_codon:yes gene_type:complete
MSKKIEDIYLVKYNAKYEFNDNSSIEGYIRATDWDDANKKLLEWCTVRNKGRVADGNSEEWEDEFDIEELFELNAKTYQY